MSVTVIRVPFDLISPTHDCIRGSCSPADPILAVPKLSMASPTQFPPNEIPATVRRATKALLFHRLIPAFHRGRVGGNLPAPKGIRAPRAYTLEEKMDQARARETAKEAAEQTDKTANEAAQRVGEQVQPALDQGKSMAQDLANRASEAARQARDRTGEFVESVAPQARRVASNLYDQGSRSAEQVRQYAAQDPLAGMLVAGVIGFALGYLVRGR
jgi:ElaB/YqjD/DUF883 family membrane-anchored ribosome-binding protein